MLYSRKTSQRLILVDEETIPFHGGSFVIDLPITFSSCWRKF